MINFNMFLGCFLPIAIRSLMPYGRRLTTCASLPCDDLANRSGTDRHRDTYDRGYKFSSHLDWLSASTASRPMEREKCSRV
jgi:hypothetical protein